MPSRSGCSWSVCPSPPGHEAGPRRSPGADFAAVMLRKAGILVLKAEICADSRRPPDSESLHGLPLDRLRILESRGLPRPSPGSSTSPKSVQPPRSLLGAQASRPPMPSAIDRKTQAGRLRSQRISRSQTGHNRRGHDASTARPGRTRRDRDASPAKPGHTRCDRDASIDNPGRAGCDRDCRSTNLVATAVAVTCRSTNLVAPAVTVIVDRQTWLRQLWPGFSVDKPGHSRRDPECRPTIRVTAALTVMHGRPPGSHPGVLSPRSP